MQRWKQLMTEVFNSVQEMLKVQDSHHGSHDIARLINY